MEILGVLVKKNENFGDFIKGMFVYIFRGLS